MSGGKRTFDNYLEGMCWKPYYAKFLGHKHNPEMGVYQNTGDYDRLIIGEIYRVKGSPQSLFDCIAWCVDVEPPAFINYYGTRPEDEWERVAVESLEKRNP